MDVLAHGLWTNIMYKAIPATSTHKKTTYWGIFFGIFPDLWAFTPIFIYFFYEAIVLHRPFRFENPQDTNHALPLDSLTHHLYNLSHSLVVWAVVFACSWLIIRKMPWALLGWALHICIDIFSHSTKFFPTPFLWPISNFHINGWSWGDPTFMLINYGSLLIFYLFVVPKLRQKFGK
jgi:hypothetical protein